MNRIVKNKPKEISCQICKHNFSSYAFASHLKFTHSMSSDDYEKDYGVFRKVKPNRRKSKKIVCQICNKTYTTVGLFGHLRDTHNKTIDDYVKKFGEFRVNVLKKKEENTEPCIICNDEKLHTAKGLGHHIKNAHKITKLNYVIKYILNDEIPKCKCGCGQEIDIKTYKPYIVTEYLTGHNSKGENNPNYGNTVSLSTREKMKLRAQYRMEEFKRKGVTAPMHSQEAIEKRASMQTDKFMERITKEYDVTILERESGSWGVYYKVQCNKCLTDFEQYHYSYFTCPKCNKRSRSQAENDIIQVLLEKNPNLLVNHNCRSILNNMELDIYFPNEKVAIEYDGLYWHGESQGKEKTYHLNKTQECEKLGIHLLHIFEDEWLNYRDVVLDKIFLKLNIFDGIKISARECSIKELSFKESSEFLNLHHLQGSDVAKNRFGLIYKDELVSVMTFSSPNISRGSKIHKKGTFELSRFAVKQGVSCRGGAGKLFSHFIKNYDPQHIISFADRRWSHQDNILYETLGFDFIHETSPSYWYFKSQLKRWHRFNFTKKKTVELGGDPTSTEWENMQKMGYDRIWDCGSLKYCWNSSNS